MEENKNMEVWNKLKQPPPERLKKIEAGRLRGKSDINPQWRYEILTEVFGMCGVGWYYTVDRKWNEPATDGQVFAFVDITLYVRLGDTVDGFPIWSQGIPANGGSMLIQSEKAGLHSNDEAYKMATTDALGNAAKMLGVAADIYAGKWDGSKYNEVIEEQPKEAKSNIPETPKITDRERSKIALEKISILFDEFFDTRGVKAELHAKIKTALSRYVFNTVSATEINKLGFPILEAAEKRFKSIFYEKKNTPERILVGEIIEPKTDDVPDLFEGE